MAQTEQPIHGLSLSALRQSELGVAPHHTPTARQVLPATPSTRCSSRSRLRFGLVARGWNVTAVVIEIIDFFIRYGEGSKAEPPAGLILMALVACILLFTGWKGWEWVYRSCGRCGLTRIARDSLA